MPFTKITNAELNAPGIGATTQPNVPTIGATALKEVFDAPAKKVIAPKFNNLIDELQATTASDSLGATAPTGRTGTTVQGVINSVSSDLALAESTLTTVVASSHSHNNKSVLDDLSDDGSGNLLYGGDPIGSSGTWGSITGDIEDQTDLADALDDKSDVGHTHTVSDITDFPTIPDDLADLNDDATHRLVSDTEKSTWNGKTTVSWNQQVLTGQKIATISIDGTPTDVYAPTGGGGGGGGAVDSVNNMTGDVVLGVSDINDVTITTIADQHTLVYNANSSIWENEKLADVALTNSYNDLDDTPTIPTITNTYSAVSTDGMSGVAVKQAIDALDKSDSAVSGQYVSAVSEANGIITVSRESLPSVPTVNNGTLTIQKNGTNVQTFTANQSTNATANIVTDAWHSTSATVSSGSVSFSGIDDSGNNGYELFVEVSANSVNKNPTSQISSISGTGTSSMSITFTTDADEGATAKLRIIK